jgi:tetratricopeptide (TPR) repeat protein
LTLAEKCASVDGNPERSEHYAVEAINLLDTLPKRGRLVFELYSKFSNFLLCQNYFSEAIKWVDVLIKMASNYPEIQTSKVEWLLTKASVLQQCGRFEEAESVHCELLKLKKQYPKDPLQRKMFEFEHYGSLALCIVLQNKKLKKAKKFARKSFSIAQNAEACLPFIMHERCAHFMALMPLILNLEPPMVAKFVEVWSEKIIREERFFQEDTADVRRFRKNVKKGICCVVCFKQSTKLKTCSACGQNSDVRYCSKKCQKKDWKEHKKICVSQKRKK